jgi:hypothetical protein
VFLRGMGDPPMIFKSGAKTRAGRPCHVECGPPSRVFVVDKAQVYQSPTYGALGITGG